VYTTFADAVSTALSATVTGLTSGSTYYFKVAAVNAVGTGAYSSASSGVSLAVTCATGGVCVLGEIGPGGGKVFYVSASAFASPGSTCNTAGVGGISACKYLEAAPTTGVASWTDVTRTWATGANQTAAVISLVGFGNGYQNTSNINAQAGNVAATSAAVEARAYRGPNNLSDWFLPSKDELNELCKYAKNTGQASGSGFRCTGGSAATGRGFLTAFYWSSSNSDTIAIPGSAWIQSFSTGTEGNFNKSGPIVNVRPVRAF
jgi:hypothetical protein